MQIHTQEPGHGNPCQEQLRRIEADQSYFSSRTRCKNEAKQKSSVARILVGECGRSPSSKPTGKHEANLIKVIWVCSNNQPQETHGSTINSSAKGT